MKTTKEPIQQQDFINSLISQPNIDISDVIEFANEHFQNLLSINENIIEFKKWSSEIVFCSVCHCKIKHDDECYSDEQTSEPLCSQHAEFNEQTNNYKSIKA